MLQKHHLPSFCSSRRILIGLATCLTLVSTLSAANAETRKDNLGFPVPLSSDLPYDVNTSALRALSDTPDKATPPYTVPDDNIPPAQRLFDIFSWQAFIALNWPALPDGQPDNKLNLADSATPRVWEYYVDAGLVYRKDGAAPIGWKDAVAASLNKTFG